MTASDPSPLEAYLAGVDPARAPVVRELDRLVREAGPELTCAVKYRMLMYTLAGRWRTWVCAIEGTTKQGVHLRFLYGTMLRGGEGILRPGSSHLATLDLATGAPVDDGLVTRLVREAVARHPELVAATGEG